MSNKMQTGPVGKTLLALALPTTISLLANMLFQLIDSYFIAQLGTQELAAMGFVYPIYIFIFGLIGGISTGVTVMISKSIASKDTQLVSEQAFTSIVYLLLIAFIFSLLVWVIQSPVFSLVGASSAMTLLLREYTDTLFLGLFLFAGCLVTNAILMSHGKMFATSVIWGIGGITNVVFDYLLIFGAGDIPALGLQGAAIATLISWFVVLFCMLVVLLRSLSFSKQAIGNIDIAVSTLTKVFKVGIPAASTQVLNPIAMILITKMVSSFGDTTIAALSIAIRIESVSLALYSALSIVFTPFVAQNLASSNATRIEHGAKVMQTTIWLWWLVLFALILLFSTPIISLFTTNNEVIATTKSYMLIVGLSYGLYGVLQITSSYLNAKQLAKKALKMAIIRSYLFMVPLTIIASFFNVQAIWWAIATANILTGLYAWWLLNENINQGDETPKQPLLSL
ncbi:hypothetical protein A9Q75_04740 [Colwellia psychrerythraea]|uniref:Multidrug-efflux transporter n=1 Tax=Colwellia psychrerythraea TaxID=28229 RepID=A0A1Y5ERV9_COLPS|nr:hypothetical protein A9Q75_04740 [Colwellia psychrerythraea]